MQDQYPSRKPTCYNLENTMRVGRPTIVRLDSVQAALKLIDLEMKVKESGSLEDISRRG